MIVAVVLFIPLRQTLVPFLDVFCSLIQPCVWDGVGSGLWQTDDLKRNNDTRFIKPSLELHLFYRNLLRYPSGMMSASGLLNSLWKRHTGNSSFKTGGD